MKAEDYDALLEACIGKRNGAETEAWGEAAWNAYCDGELVHVSKVEALVEAMRAVYDLLECGYDFSARMTALSTIRHALATWEATRDDTSK